MRNIYFLLLLFSAAVWSQELSQLKGTWVSKESDVIVIENTEERTNAIATLTSEEEMKLSIEKGKLNFTEGFYSSSDDYKKLHVLTYSFKILKLSDKELWLKPESKLAKKIFNDRNEIRFIREEFNTDNTLKFEKLIFHTTTCFGTCPVIDLEVDKDKNIYIHYQSVTDFGEPYSDDISGRFSGKLSDSLFNELIHILQAGNIRTLYFPNRGGADAPTKTIILYYNGQRKYLKSMFPPKIADRLIDFLYALPKKAKLPPTEVVRELEDKP